MNPASPEYFGSILERACGGFVKDDEIRAYVRAGRYTFLFDQEGNFLKDSMVRRGDVAV